MPFADFVWQYGKGDPCKAVKEYLQQRPAFFGIVRKDAWKDTFQSEVQYTREQVGAALLSLLELKREEWTAQVQDYKSAEARAKAEEKARREAEALAAAVARVEAEARAKALAEQLARQTAMEAEASPSSTVLDGVSSTEDHDIPDETTVSAESTDSAIASTASVAAEADIVQHICPDAASPTEAPDTPSETTVSGHPPAPPASFFTMSGAADISTPSPDDVGLSPKCEEISGAEEQYASPPEESLPSDSSADH